MFLWWCHVACRGRSRRGLESWEEGVDPKIQPRAQSLAQGLMGHLPRIFESQDFEAQVKWEQGSWRLVKVILPTRSLKDSYLAGPLTVPQLDRAWNTITLIKNDWNICFPYFCWHLPQDLWLITNLLRLKKRVDLVGESQPRWDMHEGKGKMCLGLL